MEELGLRGSALMQYDMGEALTARLTGSWHPALLREVILHCTATQWKAVVEFKVAGDNI